MTQPTRSRMRMRATGRIVLPTLAVLLVLLAGAAAWLSWPVAPIPIAPVSTTSALATAAQADPATVARGSYLAVLGNCQHCHTTRGGAPYAGGRGIATPFGMVFSSNITPSAQGLGAWSADDFWRALHHGQSRDGHWLYPAFPFTNTTRMTRADSDALYAYLRTLAPQATAVPPHQLSWPFNTQAALKLWRTLYFEEGRAPAATASAASEAANRSNAELQRGAYLVGALAHCDACHAPRNALGASVDAAQLPGGLIPVQNWYAPSLTKPLEAGVQDWSLDDIVALFQTGRSLDGMVTGPMAEVVLHSTQYWSQDDLHAMAVYLKQLPRSKVSRPSAAQEASASPNTNAERLYQKHCADCHGEQGQGMRAADGGIAYPSLAGSRNVNMESPVNLVHMVLDGGFAPATPGHPRPFGMPPFVLTLSDGEIASILSYVRSQWGNRAPAVRELDVLKLRGSGGS